MNLVIDAFRNKILIYEQGNKKIPDFWFEKQFDFSLRTLENQQKALLALAKEDESVCSRLSKGVHVIVPDFGIGFGTFDLPPLRSFKLKDVFATRFKSSYPNFDAFHVHEYEYERNSNGVLYFYSFCKKDQIQGLISAIKGIGSSVLSLDYYASGYASTHDPKSLFPHATLFVGNDHAELIITKGKKVLFIHDFGYGMRWLSQGDGYVESAYNMNYQEAMRFAAFATENFAKKISFSDENIAKTPLDGSFALSMPKEIRIMKDDVLNAYCVKNKLRKFYALIADITAHFASSPWFLPIANIDVVCEEDIAASLNKVEKSADELGFTYLGLEPFEQIAKGALGHNPLFRSGVKKERRTIDWKKLLTMEIGRKKA